MPDSTNDFLCVTFCNQLNIGHNCKKKNAFFAVFLLNVNYPQVESLGFLTTLCKV